jgi:lipopolysaccharide cholinephosphotransferase
MNFERGKGSFNQGIFVDIFPVDRVIDDENLLKKQSRKVRRLKRVLKFTRQSVGLNKNAKGARGVAKKILYYLLSPLRWLKVNERVYRRFEKECARYDNEDTKQFSLLSFDFDKKRDYKFVEDYEELIEVPFEFITIPIAKNYDRALRTEYGDYMQFVRGTMTHGDVFFDPDKSYKEYI